MENAYRADSDKERVVLVITGGSVDLAWLRGWLCTKEIIFSIAADRGLEAADSLGINVDLVVGDYDSVDSHILDKYRKNAEVVTYPPEKDYTDTHIALKYAIDKAKEINDADTHIYIVGATGSRIDHMLTNISVLIEAYRSGVNACIIDKFNKVYLSGDNFVLRKSEQYGKYVSFVPVTERVRLSLTGMKYNLCGYTLTQGESICQSNEIADDEAEVKIYEGCLIVIEAKDN